MTAPELIALVDRTFTATHPGDAFLLGSREGCEPVEEVGAFAGIADWRGLETAFLDEHYTVLSFFSEAGLRFFLPAYLVADLRGELRTADPLFCLIHGFSRMTVDLPADAVYQESGGPVLLGARRYGAITWEDFSRHRLAVFCREEAAAIVRYLEWRRDTDDLGLDPPRITAALETFWIPRSQSAPTRADVDAPAQH